MNRVQGDNFEKLLYKIFVSIDGRTSVQQLADVLRIDIALVKVSLLTRILYNLILLHQQDISIAFIIIFVNSSAVNCILVYTNSFINMTSL